MSTLENSATLPHQSKKQKRSNDKKRSRQDNGIEDEQPRKKRPKQRQAHNSMSEQDITGSYSGNTTGQSMNVSTKSTKRGKQKQEAVNPPYDTTAMEVTNVSGRAEDTVMELGPHSSTGSSSEKRNGKRKKRRDKETTSTNSMGNESQSISYSVPHASTLPIDPSLLEDYAYDPNVLPFSGAPIDFSAFGMGSTSTSDDLLRAIGGMDLTTLGREMGQEFAPDSSEPSNENEPGPPVKKRKSRAGQSSSLMYNPNDPQGLLSKWLSAAELKKAAEEHGLEYTKGNFTAAEKETVQAWFDSFASMHRLSNEQIVEMIFTPKASLKPEYKSFWIDLAGNLPKRPVTAVFNYVRRAYNPLKGQGKWTEQEDDTLRAAVVEFGQIWVKVSGRVGRPASDCRDRYRNHLVNADNRVHGPWSKEETTELIEIMAEFNYEKPQGEDQDVFWRQVSHRMGGSRSIAQIRGKWQDSLSKTFKPDGQRRWSPVDSYILVHKVATMNVANESEIDWKLLGDDGWNLWSPHIMQKRWLGMKRRVEGHEEMPFYELVDILMAKKGSLSQSEIEDALKKSQEARPVPRTPRGTNSKAYVDDSDEDL